MEVRGSWGGDWLGLVELDVEADLFRHQLVRDGSPDNADDDLGKRDGGKWQHALSWWVNEKRRRR